MVSTEAERAEKAAYMRSYRALHLDEVRAKERSWRLTKPSTQSSARRARAVRKYFAEWGWLAPAVPLLLEMRRRETRRRWNEKSAAWYRANLDKARAAAKAKEKARRLAGKISPLTPEQRAKKVARVTAWQKANPERALANKRRSRKRCYDRDPSPWKVDKAKRRALEATSPGNHTASDVRRQYLAQLGECFYCSATLGERYHVDHRQPLSRGGSNRPENLACACASCNLRKHDKTEAEFRRAFAGPR